MANGHASAMDVFLHPVALGHPWHEFKRKIYVPHLHGEIFNRKYQFKKGKKAFYDVREMYKTLEI